MIEESIQNYLEKPLPISIDELCEKKFNFIIPSYQRGYRWTEKEVKCLIKDVLAYKQEKDGPFYCLQPLVVRNVFVNGKYQWRVIDGQQRLTTIYLILKELFGGGEGCYSLEYERDNFLTQISEYRGDENSEIYHLKKAEETIRTFLIEREQVCKEVLRTNVSNHCCFIFYVMKEGMNASDEESDRMERELFNNLNSGKIPLTESELIKALFLHNIGETRLVKEVKQISMSEELDRMERTLREDEMWYFLAGDRQKPSNCIDYLYKVWYRSKYTEIPMDVDYPIFSCLEEEMSTDSRMLAKWQEIKNCFYTLTGWYSDSLLYNLIGYLEGRKKPKNMTREYPPFHDELLAGLYRYATGGKDTQYQPTRKAFINYVKEQCLKSIPQNYTELRYDTDRNTVFNILLLLNIAMLINNKKMEYSSDGDKVTGKVRETKISRYPFHVFHALNWNVEHISPQSPKEKTELYDRLCKLKKDYEDTLPEEVGRLCQKMENNKANFNALDYDAEYRALLQDLMPDKDQAMEMKNLTLLTEHDNKGIGNKFYFEKRNQLNEYQSQGSFIPAATLNVFSKWYTKHPKGFVLWGSEDQDAYEKAIKQTISDFQAYCQHNE